jgi:hypothetical protein
LLVAGDRPGRSHSDVVTGDEVSDRSGIGRIDVVRGQWGDPMASAEGFCHDSAADVACCSDDGYTHEDS